MHVASFPQDDVMRRSCVVWYFFFSGSSVFTATRVPTAVLTSQNPGRKVREAKPRPWTRAVACTPSTLHGISPTTGSGPKVAACLGSSFPSSSSAIPASASGLTYTSPSLEAGVGGHFRDTPAPLCFPSGEALVLHSGQPARQLGLLLCTRVLALLLQSDPRADPHTDPALLKHCHTLAGWEAHPKPQAEHLCTTCNLSSRRKSTKTASGSTQTQRL